MERSPLNTTALLDDELIRKYNEASEQSAGYHKVIDEYSVHLELLDLKLKQLTDECIARNINI